MRTIATPDARAIFSSVSTFALTTGNPKGFLRGDLREAPELSARRDASRRTRRLKPSPGPRKRVAEPTRSRGSLGQRESISPRELWLPRASEERTHDADWMVLQDFRDRVVHTSWTGLGGLSFPSRIAREISA
jgi:hypothetical protein